MIYVALLRGINVGGKNKIEMNLLKKSFEQVGMDSVTTYINSGNIIFINKNNSKEEIYKICENAIFKQFNLKIKVLVLNINDFKKIMNMLPNNWHDNKEMKANVLFLWHEIGNASIMKKLTIKPEIDTVKYVHGTILWMIKRNQFSKSGLSKLAGSELYQQMTIRNVNTTRKIYELMQNLKIT